METQPTANFLPAGATGVLHRFAAASGRALTLATVVVLSYGAGLLEAQLAAGVLLGIGLLGAALPGWLPQSGPAAGPPPAAAPRRPQLPKAPPQPASFNPFFQLF